MDAMLTLGEIFLFYIGGLAKASALSKTECTDRLLHRIHWTRTDSDPRSIDIL